MSQMYDQYPPPPPPPGYFQQNPFPPQKPAQTPLHLWKVVAINFGIFLCYQALLILVGDGEGYLILDMFPLIAHWVTMLILMIVSFSRGKKMYGIGHLISLILIILIGFGSCWWISDALGGARF